jgi:hypothetical protein
VFEDNIVLRVLVLFRNLVSILWKVVMFSGFIFFIVINYFVLQHHNVNQYFKILLRKVNRYLIMRFLKSSYPTIVLANFGTMVRA